MVVSAIKRALRILSSPKEEFKDLNNRTLEAVVWDYMLLLVAVSIVAGVFNLLYTVGKAFYLDSTLNIDIQYLRMLNYSLGQSTSILFLYLFSGTFLFFFLSIILKLFLYKIKYISLLKIMFYSLTPFLIFSWFFSNPLPLAIWSIFLITIGIRNHDEPLIKKDSIQTRY